MTSREVRDAELIAGDGWHVGPLEALEALDPTVGDGTPRTARYVVPEGARGASQWTPIRKIAVAAVAGGLVYVASLMGLELPSEEAQQAAQWLVPVMAGYLFPDSEGS